MSGISQLKNSRLKTHMNSGFILTDIEHTELTPEERELLKEPALFGILLFARNYESPKQLRDLTKNIHHHNPNLIIAVDQEGGRIQRFRDGFTDLKAMSYWGERYDHNPDEALIGLRAQTNTMVEELQTCGVQVSLAPVLDLNYGKSDVIGERSFHQDPAVVAVLAKTVIDTMHEHRMPSIGKHFPGHGAVTLDSHTELPIDERPKSEIWQSDIAPYRVLLENLDAIMPAHIVYSAVDDKPTGFSKRWLQEILRIQLKFQGVILSDCLSMEGAARMGSYHERAFLSLEAGCDIVTLCNCKEGLIQVLDNYREYVKFLSNERILKYIRFLS